MMTIETGSHFFVFFFFKIHLSPEAIERASFVTSTHFVDPQQFINVRH